MSAVADSAAPRPAAAPQRLLLALLLAMLGLRFHLAVRFIGNWDEFRTLSLIYDYVRQVPIGLRQTFMVHFFQWLPSIQPADEVSQIVVARVVLMTLGLATSGLLYIAGRRFLSTAGALFAVLCYNALTEVLIHGASFRPDPMATFLLAAALAVLVVRPASLWAAAGAGALLALSFVLTVKTVFFLPSLAVVVLAQTPGEVTMRRRLGALAALAVTMAIAVALLGAFHRQAIVEVTSSIGQAEALKKTGARALWTGYWFPGRHYLLRSFEQSALVWLLLLGGFIVALFGLRDRQARGKLLPLLALVLPLGTLIFYRNSFPYYLAYLLAPAPLLCGLSLDRLSRVESRSGRLGRVLGLAIVLGVFATGLTNYLRQLPHGLDGQRQLVETIHRMFPEPVPYIDRCSMIASFPKVGFFMSTWGMQNYGRERRAVLSEAVRTRAPRFVLANTLALNLLLPESEATRFRYRLGVEDRQTLRQNYIHHWGIIFVAGKRLETAGGEAALEILIPGPYTLEGELAATIDGRLVRPGESIDLTAGLHRVATQAAGTLTLRWGRRIYRPEKPPPRGPIFVEL